MSYSSKLKLARIAAKMTQEQLGAKIGVAKSTIAGYERGTSEPDMNKIARILDALNIDANYLWTDVESSNDFSPQETALIEKYRNLDPHGRRMINVVLSEEHERMTALPGEATLDILMDAVPQPPKTAKSRLAAADAMEAPTNTA